MKPTKKTNGLWSSFKNEQKLFENWRQYTKGDTLNEGMFDWFGGGKEEEPAPAPEAQEEPEAAAEAHWQPFEEEIKSLYTPIVMQLPSRNEIDWWCRTDRCKQHITKFWEMAHAAGATSQDLRDRKEPYIKAYVEGGPEAVQALFERWRQEGYDNFGLSGWVHRARNDGSLIVDKDWANELELQLEFVKSEIERSKNPSAPEPESREEEEYEWRGGDLRRKRGYHPGGNVPVSENKQRKTRKVRLLKRRK